LPFGKVPQIGPQFIPDAPKDRHAFFIRADARRGWVVKALLQLGLPLNFYSDYVSRVSALTIPELEACAKTLLNPQEIVWMVVGDRAQLEAPLRALNIGEIVSAAA
jgi:hypothetical protein